MLLGTRQDSDSNQIGRRIAKAHTFCSRLLCTSAHSHIKANSTLGTDRLNIDYRADCTAANCRLWVGCWHSSALLLRSGFLRWTLLPAVHGFDAGPCRACSGCAKSARH